MMSRQFEALAKLNASASDYRFSFTFCVCVCVVARDRQNMMIHAVSIIKFPWSSVHAFQKEQKL